MVMKNFYLTALLLVIGRSLCAEVVDEATTSLPLVSEEGVVELTGELAMRASKIRGVEGEVVADEEQASEEDPEIGSVVDLNMVKDGVLHVDGSAACSNLDGVDKVVGKADQHNEVYLLEDWVIDHPVAFENVTLVGNELVRGFDGETTVGTKHSIETLGKGKVTFGANVILQNCLLKNLKQAGRRS